jgi:tetratricopeptide (TPR) repeat protein
MKILLAALTMVLVVAVGSASIAGQNDPRLDGLFTQLREATDAREAQRVERVIWQIWFQADDGATRSLMELGLAAMQRNDLPAALQLFDAITVQRPDFAEGWNRRATVLFMLGAHERSLADIEKTLTLEPRHFGALSGLGMIRSAQNRPEDALKAFEAALKLHPHLTGVKQNVEALRRKVRDGAI